MRLWGGDDRLTRRGHRLAARACSSLRPLIEECIEEGLSLRDVVALITNEIFFCFMHLLEEKGRR